MSFQKCSCLSITRIVNLFHATKRPVICEGQKRKSRKEVLTSISNTLSDPIQAFPKYGSHGKKMLDLNDPGRQ